MTQILTIAKPHSPLHKVIFNAAATVEAAVRGGWLMEPKQNPL